MTSKDAKQDPPMWMKILGIVGALTVVSAVGIAQLTDKPASATPETKPAATAPATPKKPDYTDVTADYRMKWGCEDLLCIINVGMSSGGDPIDVREVRDYGSYLRVTGDGTLNPVEAVWACNNVRGLMSPDGANPRDVEVWNDGPGAVMTAHTSIWDGKCKAN